MKNFEGSTGQWKKGEVHLFGKNQFYQQVYADCILVATVNGKTFAECSANSHLIGAAFDMANAIEAYLDFNNGKEDQLLYQIMAAAYKNAHGHPYEKVVNRRFTGYYDNHGNKIWSDSKVSTYCYNSFHIHDVDSMPDGTFKAGGYSLDSIYYAGSGDNFKVINPEGMITEFLGEPVWMSKERMDEINTVQEKNVPDDNTILKYDRLMHLKNLVSLASPTINVLDYFPTPEEIAEKILKSEMPPIIWADMECLHSYPFSRAAGPGKSTTILSENFMNIMDSGKTVVSENPFPVDEMKMRLKVLSVIPIQNDRSMLELRLEQLKRKKSKLLSLPKSERGELPEVIESINRVKRWIDAT